MCLNGILLMMYDDNINEWKKAVILHFYDLIEEHMTKFINLPFCAHNYNHCFWFRGFLRLF